MTANLLWDKLIRGSIRYDNKTFLFPFVLVRRCFLAASRPLLVSVSCLISFEFLSPLVLVPFCFVCSRIWWWSSCSSSSQWNRKWIFCWRCSCITSSCLQYSSKGCDCKLSHWSLHCTQSCTRSFDSHCHFEISQSSLWQWWGLWRLILGHTDSWHGSDDSPVESSWNWGVQRASDCSCSYDMMGW